MGDERRNDGSGAVVAIILVLGIVVLLGVIVVVGGAFFFLAHEVSAPLPAPTATMATPPPTAVAPSSPVQADLEPAKSLEEVEALTPTTAPPATKE